MMLSSATYSEAAEDNDATLDAAFLDINFIAILGASLWLGCLTVPLILPIGPDP